MGKLITRRNLLVATGLAAVLGLGVGSTSAQSDAEPMTVEVDASNIRGYWASNRNDGQGED